jgi:hypothetical protein
MILYHQKIDLNLKHIAYERCVVKFGDRLVMIALFFANGDMNGIGERTGCTVQISR